MSNQDTLFDIRMPEPGAPAPRRSGWGGSKSTKARARIRAILPAPCWRCGGIITREEPETSWQAGHPIDRMDGGSDQDTQPEHTTCNLSAGGKRGAAITNARHQHQQAGPVYRDKEPQWW